VLLVGHNPGLEALVLELASTGEQLERVAEKFPTGALATLTIAGPWSRLAPRGAALAAYVVPREL
jgi:phosphohistidine phosphatase